jgi:DNA repair exonuclease SbcCD ATPase subunit
VSSHLKQEIGQLKEDIQTARENSFGRRIFEAYAAEFTNTHLSENKVVRDLKSQLADREHKLSEATRIVHKAKTLVESKDQEIRAIRESNSRNAIMEELLTPLNEDKRSVMKDLLESVQTARLKNAYEKYLPAVLAETSLKARKVISESVREVTGDKTVPTVPREEDQSNVIALKRLAGL